MILLLTINYRLFVADSTLIPVVSKAVSSASIAIVTPSHSGVLLSPVNYKCRIG